MPTENRKITSISMIVRDKAHMDFTFLIFIHTENQTTARKGFRDNRSSITPNSLARHLHQGVG